MLYLPLIVIAAVGIFAVTRNAPRRATAIGIAAVVMDAASAGVATLTGNFLLLYLGLGSDGHSHRTRSRACTCR